MTYPEILEPFIIKTRTSSFKETLLSYLTTDQCSQRVQCIIHEAHLQTIAGRISVAVFFSFSQ